MNRLKRHLDVLIAVGLILMTAICVFTYSLKIRRPYYNTISLKHHQWNLAVPILFVNNWLRENPFKIYFAMLYNPASVEFTSLHSRELYVSYPVGAIFPIYLFSLLLRQEPTIPIIMTIALINHYFTALFLGLFVFVLLKKLRLSTFAAFVFSLIPILLELLLPSPLYYFQQAYFTDQAVLLPLVLFIFLELWLDFYENKKIRFAVSTLQVIVIFYGVLTDWLFLILLIAFYIKRFITNYRHRLIKPFIPGTLIFFLPAILALGLYTIQISFLGEMSQLSERFLSRTGIWNDGVNPRAFAFAIKSYIQNGYGETGLWLLMISAVIIYLIGIFMYIAYRKGRLKINRNTGLLYIYNCMFILVPLTQIVFFKVHSANHDFSVLKFSLTIAIVPFVLLPVLISLLFRHTTFRILPLVMLAAAILYLRGIFPLYKIFFPLPDPSIQNIGAAVRSCTTFNDVVFSPQFEIGPYPPQMLAFSLKRVYKIYSLSDIRNKIKSIRGDHSIVVIFFSNPEGQYDYVEKIAIEKIRCGEYFLYRLDSKKING
ncbi:MAG: hypothetical protein UX91_C0006G0083 [Candidatus Amesbacteria bacterium GW2011_GWB1_47_19]|nr:MAG: hypothetical protein UW51_C0002G0084 [Candidatus Amesbacteria bacterium GW2011_GWA1_44_24]KKU31326.1 MAG: hypothetical protein UX46_C0006G0118 [Candidatus Amesbacteria bacterium GW2011_GWC1_46_24]KKU67021.1 MAG: hypothetical protein UX91_C0006G0083 [Candidatus Amesbacteria bacterium GW2011_GWB1_47_19]OGD04820.1 MAG: hypothetical protein A2379_04605 [Candidatus Amesbacteria bacterium RIFOXYB1_FULL_47_13]HBC72760.1 hypothetical protein [Candidatus Amesbacteria bacterium]